MKTLGLRAGITIKIIPKIKRMPRERVTTLTLTKQRKPLVNNIVYTNSETKKRAARKQYIANPEPKKRAARKQYSNHPEKKRLPYVYAWLSTVILIICAKKRPKYALGEPKLDVKDICM